MKKTTYARLFTAAALFVAVAAPFAHAADASCVFDVSPAAVSVSNDGSADLKVTASSQACSFSAKSNVDWVAVSPAQGQGSGIVHLSIAQSVEPKAGTVTIAGQEITVFQNGVPVTGWGN